jgi:nicotinamidase-related amidase
MKVPDSGRKRALFVVDVQPSFLDARSKYIVPNIVRLIGTVPYEAYAVATFHADKGSLWDTQQEWTCPMEATDIVIATALESRQPINIEKDSRSAFKGAPRAEEHFRLKQIKEVHIVGTQTNDCIFATALESFDLGFIPYVIEECCEAATKDVHDTALTLLRRQQMTNNSCIESISYFNV